MFIAFTGSRGGERLTLRILDQAIADRETRIRVLTGESFSGRDNGALDGLRASLERLRKVRATWRPDDPPSPAELVDWQVSSRSAGTACVSVAVVTRPGLLGGVPAGR